MNLDGYNQFGGTHLETAAVKNVLAHYGVRAPHTGEPFSEALLFGINGGIGASYFNFEYEGFGPTLFIGTTARYKTKSPDLLKGMVDRLGLATLDKTTGSAQVGVKNLKAGLAAGAPVIVFLSMGHLPYYAMEESWRGYEHAVVVYGYDEDTAEVLMADLASTPVTVETDTLAEARAFVSRIKNRSLVIEPVAGEIGADVLEQAVRDGIQACITPMLDPPTPKSNFGLNALAKWADLAGDLGNKKGWARVFPPGPFLVQAQRQVFAYIETLGTGGSASRGLYADFLDEAGQVLGNPGLGEVAAQFREAAGAWTDLAETALPDDVPQLAELKSLARQKMALTLAQGEAAIPELEALGSREAAIVAELEAAYPLDEAGAAAFFERLSGQIRQVHELETAAVEGLQDSI